MLSGVNESIDPAVYTLSNRDPFLCAITPIERDGNIFVNVMKQSITIRYSITGHYLNCFFSIGLNRSHEGDRLLEGLQYGTAISRVIHLAQSRRSHPKALSLFKT